MEGLLVSNILINSSLILSAETILILFDCLFIALKQFSSILKPNLEEKYAARIILSGSSENVSSGDNGVFIICFSMSLIPPKGSVRSPKRDG